MKQDQREGVHLYVYFGFRMLMFGIWTYHFRDYCDCELGKDEEVELRDVRESVIDGFLNTIGTFYKTITLPGIYKQISSAGVVLQDNWAQTT